MSQEEMTQLALELRKIGVSNDGVYQVLSQYPIEVVRQQLAYLPYRRAKRPEAMIIEAIRKNYSAPNLYYYAKAQAELTAAVDTLDQDSEHTLRPADPDTEGHGTPSSSDPASPDLGMESGRASDFRELPNFDGEIR